MYLPHPPVRPLLYLNMTSEWCASSPYLCIFVFCFYPIGPNIEFAMSLVSAWPPLRNLLFYYTVGNKLCKGTAVSQAFWALPSQLDFLPQQ